MRLERDEVLKDHDALLDQTEHDHHPKGDFFKIIINAQVIAANSAYEHRVNLGREGFKTLRGILRGEQNIGTQGHTGCFFLASETSEEGIGMSNTYTSTYYIYMGAFSRLHGDSYLSEAEFGGNTIVLRDAYIDGDEAVLEFYNTFAASKTLKVYGTVAVK